MVFWFCTKHLFYDKKAYPKRSNLAGSGVNMLLQKYKDFFVVQNVLLENCHLEGCFFSEF